MEEHKRPGTPRPRRRWIILIGLGVTLLLMPLAWLLRPGTFLGETLPNPNGYEDLVAAGREITGDFTKVIKQEEDTEALRALVAENRDVLDRARVGLGRESIVPLAKIRSVAAHMNDLSAKRSLGRLLAYEAILAERNGQTAEAAVRFADVIRFGRAISSGGLILDRLAKGAVQFPGVEGLARLAPTLTGEDARRLARVVERLDRGREPLHRVFDRDLAFNLDRGGVPLRISYMINRRMMQGLLAPAIKSAEQADRRDQAYLRLLAATLALRAYRLDHPDAPTPPALDALVPAYLNAVPADPFGWGPLKFRANAGRVYSVGPDGLDDDGTPPPSRFSTGGDLLLVAPPSRPR